MPGNARAVKPLDGSIKLLLFGYRIRDVPSDTSVRLCDVTNNDRTQMCIIVCQSGVKYCCGSSSMPKAYRASVPECGPQLRKNEKLRWCHTFQILVPRSQRQEDRELEAIGPPSRTLSQNMLVN